MKTELTKIPKALWEIVDHLQTGSARTLFEWLENNLMTTNPRIDRVELEADRTRASRSIQNQNKGELLIAKGVKSIQMIWRFEVKWVRPPVKLADSNPDNRDLTLLQLLFHHRDRVKAREFLLPNEAALNIEQVVLLLQMSSKSMKMSWQIRTIDQEWVVSKTVQFYTNQRRNLLRRETTTT